MITRRGRAALETVTLPVPNELSRAGSGIDGRPAGKRRGSAAPLPTRLPDDVPRLLPRFYANCEVRRITGCRRDER
jgi:hypothetical protein